MNIDNFDTKLKTEVKGRRLVVIQGDLSNIEDINIVKNIKTVGLDN